MADIYDVDIYIHTHAYFMQIQKFRQISLIKTDVEL